MDSLGNSDPDIESLDDTIRAAARQALHDWGRTMESRGGSNGELEDLVQDLWAFYLDPRNKSVQKFVASRTTETGRRRVFYRLEKGENGKSRRAGLASQIIVGQQAESDLFQADQSYSSESIKEWLRGESTNKYLGKLITQAMDRLYQDHLVAIKSRYEDGVIPSRTGPAKDVLLRAHVALTEAVNGLHQAEKSEEGQRPTRGVQAGSRRGGGGYSDPTADMALGLIQGGDTQIELASGEVTTMRKEFNDADNIMAMRYDQPTQPWAGIDLFEGELNDRTDMYRAQVFPELYPNEKPMLVQNWEPEDQAAYLGGEYTAGYRRLKVVR